MKPKESRKGLTRYQNMDVTRMDNNQKKELNTKTNNLSVDEIEFTMRKEGGCKVRTCNKPSYHEHDELATFGDEHDKQSKGGAKCHQATTNKHQERHDGQRVGCSLCR